MTQPHPFDAVDESRLRRRRSVKWTYYPADVLPAWVAEMDYPLPEPVRVALAAAIADDDCGYAHPHAVREAFAAWADVRWSWGVSPSDTHLFVDVVTAIAELLRVATSPGDRIVIDTPVYPPFAATIEETGRVVVATPLVVDAVGRSRLDLEAIEAAYAAGAKAHLLCSPHNPSGTVPTRDELATLAELARRYDVFVLSDEIHAPLTLAGAQHVPFAMVSEAARERCVVLTSASKTYNLAGLKASVAIAPSPRARAVMAKLPPATPFHAGHLGVLAANVAFREGEAWLASVRTILDRNRVLLSELLGRHLPDVRYVAPRAGYLAWLDCRPLGLGDDPARVFLEKGKVALSSGPTFGAEGAGFARLNFATTASLLERIVERMAQAVGMPGR